MIQRILFLTALWLSASRILFVASHPRHHYIWVPTVSPYPTETAAPSPSPSDFPTDTQAPSSSLRPSDVPSDFPSFRPSEEPSYSPTLYPTESPAPSPSPSETPTLQPSDTPSLSQQPTTSQQPSSSPTTGAPSDYPSVAPSSAPSLAPSSQPTISPAPTITAQPTGFVFLVARNVEIMFQSVTQTMQESHITFFQEETKIFLQNNLHHVPGVLDIQVQAVTVSSQKLVGARRRTTEANELQRQLKQDKMQNPQALVVSMQVVAMALLDPKEHFDLEKFLDVFFENYENLLALRRSLEQEESFSKDIFWQRHSLEGNDRDRSMAGSTAGAVFGVTVSLVGLVGVLMWWIRRKRIISIVDEEKDPDELHQMTFSHSYDTDECLPDSIPTKKFVVDSRTFETTALSLSHSKEKLMSTTERDAPSGDDDFEHLEAQSDGNESVGSVIEPPHLMYTPVLMSTESNIEVPETPVTAFTGAKSTLVTPHGSSIAKSGGYSFDANSILDASAKIPPLPNTSFSRSEKAVCALHEDEHKRKHLLPQIPHIWKSPFRREATKESDDDSKDSDGESDNGSDVVVTPFASEDIMVEQTRAMNHKKSLQNVRTSRPPIEIGGPDTIPSLVQSQVSEDNSVDIVNEVSYLYSTTPERKD